jgi:hypothetical protein
VTTKSPPRAPPVWTQIALARVTNMLIAYVAMTAIDARMLDRELKKGSAELFILSTV